MNGINKKNNFALSLLIFVIAISLSGCVFVPDTPESRFIVSSNLPLSVAWMTDVEEPIVSQPAIGNEIVVVKTRKRFYEGAVSLLGIEINTGNKLWKREFTSGISTSILMLDDIAYVGDYERRVWALDGRTGTVLWRYEFSKDAAHIGDIVIDGNVLYAATSPTIFVAALAVRSGNVIWERYNDLGYRGVNLFLNHEELIVIALDSVHVLDRNTGEEIRSIRNTNPAELGAPQQIYNSRLYGTQTVLDAKTFDVVAKLGSTTTQFLGDKCEQFRLPYTFNQTFVYASGNCGGVFALDSTQNYQQRWSVNEAYECAAPMGLFHDTLYFLTENGMLVGVDPATGKKIGNLQTSRTFSKNAEGGLEFAGVVTSPRNMFVYFGDTDIWSFRFTKGENTQ